MMARAHSNKSIVVTLFVQPRTVEHHISSILAKLGFTRSGDRHGRVSAILTSLEASGQLPAFCSGLGQPPQPAQTPQDHCMAA